MKAYQIKGQYTALVNDVVVTTAIDGLCDAITIADDRVIIDGRIYPDRVIDITEAAIVETDNPLRIAFTGGVSAVMLPNQVKRLIAACIVATEDAVGKRTSVRDVRAIADVVLETLQKGRYLRGVAEACESIESHIGDMISGENEPVIVTDLDLPDFEERVTIPPVALANADADQTVETKEPDEEDYDRLLRNACRLMVSMKIATVSQQMIAMVNGKTMIPCADEAMADNVYTEFKRRVPTLHDNYHLLAKRLSTYLEKVRVTYDISKSTERAMATALERMVLGKFHSMGYTK